MITKGMKGGVSVCKSLIQSYIHCFQDKKAYVLIDDVVLEFMRVWGTKDRTRQWRLVARGDKNLAYYQDQKIVWEQPV